MTDDGSVSEDRACAVLEAIGLAEGVHPAELDYPVYDWIDLEALAALFDQSKDIKRVTFTVRGHELAITNQTITIDGTSYQIDQLHNR